MNDFAETLLQIPTRLLPARIYRQLLFITKAGYMPNTREPTTFNELMLRKMNHDRNPLIGTTADKYLLRAYVEEAIGDGYLPELLDVVEDASQVDVSKLPPAYAMKAAHGSGWNRIVSNSELGQEEAQRLAADWLGRNFYWRRKEWAYRNLTPRVVFEENLSENGVAPTDYKLFCFHGETRLVDVHVDRFQEHRRAFFTQDWEPVVQVQKGHAPPNNDVARPTGLQEMIELARPLGKPFDFARIDFYDVKGKVLVGEITHYPRGGVLRFVSRELDLEFGELWRTGKYLDKRFLKH